MFKMPKKPKKTLFNFHLPKKRSSTGNAEENRINQDPGPPSTCYETLSLPRPTRAAKQMCIENVSNILIEEKSFNSKVYERKSGERRLKNLRQNSSKRLGKESTEKRLEDLPNRAIIYCEKKNNCGLKIKTVDKINQEYNVQSSPVSARRRRKQRRSVTNLSEFDKCIIEEIVSLFHAKKKRLTVQKILDATKQRLDGFNCSYSSMRRILLNLGYKFKNYPTDGEKKYTYHEPTEEAEGIEVEKSECTELIAEMGRRYMSMFKTKEEYEIEIEVCPKNNESAIN